MILGTGQYNLYYQGELRRRTNNQRVVDLFVKQGWTTDPIDLLLDYIETVLDNRNMETVETLTDNWS